MGRRLVVLGSAPAFEEVADEEGVEDAISSVVPGLCCQGSSAGQAQGQAVRGGLPGSGAVGSP